METIGANGFTYFVSANKFCYGDTAITLMNAK